MLLPDLALPADTLACASCGNKYTDVERLESVWIDARRLQFGVVVVVVVIIIIISHVTHTRLHALRHALHAHQPSEN